jgi:hypothetical protein
MNIQEIINSNSGWEYILQNNKQELDELVKAFERTLPVNISLYIADHRRDYFTDKGWRIIYAVDKVKALIKKEISISFFDVFDSTNKWLDHVEQSQNINVFALFTSLETGKFYKVYPEIFRVDPTKRSQKFAIIGYTTKNVSSQINIVSLSSSFTKATLSRSIEFPPEYHQAGVGILNFFGTYLREKYPNEEAKVTIEQDGLIVRLIVETKDGKLKTVEQALNEYKKIITGEVSPESFTKDQHLILAIKTELRVANIHIETQRDIIRMQNGTLSDQKETIIALMNLVNTSLNSNMPITQNVTVINNVELNQNISNAIATLSELKELLQPTSHAFLELQNIESALDSIEKEKDPAIVKKSGALSQLKSFLDKAIDGNDEIKKTIEAAKSGWDTLKILAGKYNSIAQWCGLPQIPKIFTK